MDRSTEMEAEEDTPLNSKSLQKTTNSEKTGRYNHRNRLIAPEDCFLTDEKKRGALTVAPDNVRQQSSDAPHIYRDAEHMRAHMISVHPMTQCTNGKKLLPLHC